MENQKILEEAKKIAMEMVKSNDFSQKDLVFGKLTFGVCLFKKNVEIIKPIFIEPFEVNEHVFCLVSV